jgi:hypothetical protein
MGNHGPRLSVERRWPPCRCWEISFSLASCVSWLGLGSAATRREVALIDYRIPKVWPFWPKISPDSPKVMRQTLQLRDWEGGSTLGMESGMEDGDVWGRNRNCQVNQWHTDLGLIGTLGWELMQMDDGTFERPKAGASIVGRGMAWQRHDRMLLDVDLDDLRS